MALDAESGDIPCEGVMNRLVRTAVICGAIGAALVIAPTGRAQSIGCMRMPSTIGQFFGYGYGAGHHAPIVRTPGMHPERVQRRAISPAACGPLGPAPYEMMGCYDGVCPSGACQGGACMGGGGGGPYLGGAPAAMRPTQPMMAPVPPQQYAPQMHGPQMQPPMAMRPTAGYVVR
jgi:hypothetical protein